ncbi:hypothetical protein Ahy_B01g056944 [Arachis hypogaea]|uniref:Uncharacterized protein n=1 Tax=Arachis hypogaea TaxID=3818 RepID=A0A445AZW2_ARAHY|nr:hypothetical protein Ahy_B01g056944 [Arachis hypogaea]
MHPRSHSQLTNGVATFPLSVLSLPLTICHHPFPLNPLFVSNQPASRLSSPLTSIRVTTVLCCFSPLSDDELTTLNDNEHKSTYCLSLYEHCKTTPHTTHIYSQALEKLAPHIQQVSMESNGKGVLIDGVPLPFEPGEIDFGEVGSNHDELMSSFFAQPDALAYEKDRCPRLLSTLSKIQTSLLRFYVVHGLQANRRDRVIDFFAVYGSDLLQRSHDWTRWFGAFCCRQRRQRGTGRQGCGPRSGEEGREEGGGGDDTVVKRERRRIGVVVGRGVPKKGVGGRVGRRG